MDKTLPSFFSSTELDHRYLIFLHTLLNFNYHINRLVHSVVFNCFASDSYHIQHSYMVVELCMIVGRPNQYYVGCPDIGCWVRRYTIEGSVIIIIIRFVSNKSDITMESLNKKRFFRKQLQIGKLSMLLKVWIILLLNLLFIIVPIPSIHQLIVCASLCVCVFCVSHHIMAVTRERSLERAAPF